MAIPKQKVIKGLRKKGFQVEDREGHPFYVYWSLDGKKTPVNTHTSRGSEKYRDLGEDLVHQMADQCKLDKKNFVRLIECPMNQEEYEAHLKSKKGHLTA